MTQTEQAERVEEARRPEPGERGRSDLGPVGNAVSDRVEDLLRGYLADRSEAVAALARLRGGAGKTFGECPQLWGLTVDSHAYAAPGWSRDRQDRAEEAVHAALSLFALHQQSLRGASGGDENRMHRRVRYLDGDRGRRPHYGLGWAVRACMGSGEIDTALHNRLKKAAQASSLRTRVGELRQIVAHLRRNRVALDYGLLADQLFQAQEPRGITRVRNEWGHGFVSYRPAKNDGTASDDTTTASEKEHQ
ncbi:type I-E CRISPR-associated protein Cse2/CasB [Nocardiopsis sp. CNT312]|uniref:type I-E CRISPR-associated protein Cse2/CasB n=1 Tax=Nocardiopsis sp. CNT312 TaxID=1137268 RepID=UPI0009E05DFE|nr:type I-E CRISPR-associated protein Cse2/CasB [Nocardiopsis sp. CNT312]